jgi:threonine dehydrogenase-like Zn-dependent dehydrogenase
LGLGPVGHLGAQLFRACGYTVFAVDPVESRRALLAAKGIPAFAAVPLEDKAVAGDISLALECSGHEQAVLDACKAVRKRGEVVMVGVPRVRRTQVYAFDVLAAVFRGYVTLRSGWEWEIARHPADFRVGSVFGNMAGAIRWLAEGRLNLDNLYALARPSDAQKIYQDLLNHRSPAPSMLFDWRGAW